MQQKKDSIVEIVTNRIIALLEQGVIPWQCMFKSALPQNFISKKPYKGFNWLLLSSFDQYESPYWLTYKQIQDQEGSLLKDQHSTPITFWKFLKKNDDDGDESTIPMMRYYRVFNLEQTDIKHKEPKVFVNYNPIQDAEQIVNNMPNKPTIRHKNNQGAKYISATDTITIPKHDHFTSMEYYYHTLFHELTHSTGHSTRLNRKLGNTFGSQDYSKEELVAEIGASMLCHKVSMEITDKTIDNTASYISSWLRALQNDRRMIISAAGQAQKAFNYILNIKESYESESKVSA